MAGGAATIASTGRNSATNFARRRLQHAILQEAHNSAGHPGINKTQQLLAKMYYWPSMKKDVRTHVLECDLCQRIKAPRTKPGGLLQAMPIPTRPWEQVTMDLIVGLPPTPCGDDAILVFTDKFSRMVHLPSTTETSTAEDVADLFLKHVYRLHGLPKSIISDRSCLPAWRPTYKLELPPHMKVHPVFDTSLLRPYYGQPPTRPHAQWDTRDPEFEVERIEKHRRRRNSYEFLVHWKGYPPSYATWEPLRNLDHAKDVLHDYCVQHNLDLQGRRSHPPGVSVTECI